MKIQGETCIYVCMNLPEVKSGFWVSLVMRAEGPPSCYLPI